jgi:hypothetical protein
MANAMGRSSWNATGTGLSRKSTLEQNTLQPLDNPFGPRLSPMSSERSVTYVSGPDTDNSGEPAGTRTQDHLIKSQVLYQLSYGLRATVCMGRP